MHLNGPFLTRSFCVVCWDELVTDSSLLLFCPDRLVQLSSPDWTACLDSLVLSCKLCLCAHTLRFVHATVKQPVREEGLLSNQTGSLRSELHNLFTVCHSAFVTYESYHFLALEGRSKILFFTHSHLAQSSAYFQMQEKEKAEDLKAAGLFDSRPDRHKYEMLNVIISPHMCFLYWFPVCNRPLCFVVYYNLISQITVCI